MPSSVILGTARTPFGKMGGALSSLDATDLGGQVIEAALERSSVDPAQVQQVVFGGKTIGLRSLPRIGGDLMTGAAQMLGDLCGGCGRLDRQDLSQNREIALGEFEAPRENRANARRSDDRDERLN